MFKDGLVFQLGDLPPRTQKMFKDAEKEAQRHRGPFPVFERLAMNVVAGWRVAIIQGRRKPWLAVVVSVRSERGSATLFLDRGIPDGSAPDVVRIGEPQMTSFIDAETGQLVLDAVPAPLPSVHVLGWETSDGRITEDGGCTWTRKGFTSDLFTEPGCPRRYPNVTFTLTPPVTPQP